MIERIWLISDAETGEVSYVQHGAEGDEENWTLAGPFAFTTKEAAEAAAKNPTFLPEGVNCICDVMPVEATDFIRAIFNGFAPSHTDVFMLSGNLYPLTRAGSVWIDEVLDVPLWSRLFDEDLGGIDWLDKVLERVAKVLGVEMETVHAIGHMNAEAEDEAQAMASVRQSEAIVRANVRLAVVPEPGTFVRARDGEHLQLDTDTLFWVHTMGMSRIGLPELELRDVPAAWVFAAGQELNSWAAYSIDQGLSEDDILDAPGPVPLQYKVVESDEDFWRGKGVMCLRLVLHRVRFKESHKEHGPETVH